MADPSSPSAPAPPAALTLVAAVALGGALGALLRAAQGGVIAQRGAEGPLAVTLLVNVVGTLALGALLGLVTGDRRGTLARAFLGVGVFGAYTTFGTYELVVLAAARVGHAATFTAGSLLLGLAAGHLGLRLGRRGPRGLAIVALCGPLLALALTSLFAARPSPIGGAPPLALVAACVGAGGAAGALCRWGVSLASVRLSRVFPWGTLGVNVVGSLLAGLLAPAGLAHALVVTGWLGGLTTFSTFSCEALRLSESGRQGLAVLFVLANVLLGLLAATAGVALST